MGLNLKPMINLFNKRQAEYVKSEYYTKRKHNGRWIPVEYYPTKCQVIAIRKIAPSGYQKKWLSGEIHTYKPIKTKEGYEFEFCSEK